jgi:hypothetical protein
LKDIDFLDEVKYITFVNREGQKPLLEILEKDAMFFATVDIIDYSVLLGEASDTYYIKQ